MATYKVVLTRRAHRDYEALEDYIFNDFGDSGLRDFKELIDSKVVSFLSRNPWAGSPQQSRKIAELRRWVPHPNLSVYYTVDEPKERVVIRSLFDNRQNPKEWH